jgi:hypothetical protein
VTIAFLMTLFISDYHLIKAKIAKDEVMRLNQIEHEYNINHCEAKGHLQALKSRCNELKKKIELLKKVKYKII